MSIQEAVPHIFRRPLLEITPQTPLSQLAVFLATGPRIYVDGMTVLIYRKPVGRIGGKHILNYIRYSNNSDWSNVFASDLMEGSQISVESIDTISSVISIFKKTKFAFAPVMMKGQTETSISVRDLLPLIVDAKISESCKRSKVSIWNAYILKFEQSLTIGNNKPCCKIFNMVTSL
jgi:predicted transcriptional regulator